MHYEVINCSHSWNIASHRLTGNADRRLLIGKIANDDRCSACIENRYTSITYNTRTAGKPERYDVYYNVNYIRTYILYTYII